MSSTEHDDLHDAELSRLYRELPVDLPTPALDERIRAEARRAVAAGPRRWMRPLPMTGLATAATVLLAIGMVRFWQAEQPEELVRAVSVASAPAAEVAEATADAAPETAEAAAPVATIKSASAVAAAPPARKAAAEAVASAQVDQAAASAAEERDQAEPKREQMAKAIAPLLAAKPVAEAPVMMAPAPAPVGQLASGLNALRRADEAGVAKAEPAMPMADGLAEATVPAETQAEPERDRRAFAAAPAAQAQAETKTSMASAPTPRYEELVASGRYVEALAHWDPAQMASASLQQKAEYDLLAALVHGPQAEAPLCPAELKASKSAATQLCWLLQQLRTGQPVADEQLEGLLRRWRRATPSRRYLERAMRDLVQRASP